MTTQPPGREASCTCGALRLACAGEPRKVSMCHCLACQRRTGSLFSIAAFYDREAVAVTAGTAKTFTRSSDIGRLVTFHFCPECGTSLYWEPERMPHLIGVAVGAFADPDFPRPVQAVFAETKHRWLDLPEDIHVFTTLSASAATQG